MATYYVRKSGNNGNTGLSPAQAWLTINNAANNVAAGDLVHIGAGMYRERVVMDTAGTSGNEIEYRGDYTGENTGDPGQVVISAHNSPNGIAIRDQSLDMNYKEFIIWRYVIFSGGTHEAVGPGVPGTSTAYEGCVFDHCMFCGGNSGLWHAVDLDLNLADTPTGDGLQFLGCVFVNGVRVICSDSMSQHRNIKWDWENCIFFGRAYTTDYGIHFLQGVGGSFSVGGADINECLFFSHTNCIRLDRMYNAGNQIRGLNCVAIGAQAFMVEVNSTNNVGYEDYNLPWASETIKFGDIQQGGHSDRTISFPHMGAISDMTWWKLLGWSPWLPWEPIDDSLAIGYADAATALAEDIYGSPRPMGRNTDDCGAVEARARPEDETVTVYDGSHAIKLAGQGFHDFLIPTDAGQITVIIWARYDGNYAGSLPLLELLNIPGVADQNDIMTAAADTWEQLTITATPTSTGYVRARIRSRDTSANGECYFDLLGVT